MTLHVETPPGACICPTHSARREAESRAWEDMLYLAQNPQYDAHVRCREYHVWDEFRRMNDRTLAGILSRWWNS